MEILTLKNRYREPFEGMYDGEKYVVVDTLAVPAFIAHHLKRQSIFRDNPIAGVQEYRLAIQELDGEMDEILELPPESLDRSDMEHPKVKYVDSKVRPTPPAQRGSGRFDSMPMTKERG